MPIPDFIKTRIKENKTNYTYCDISHSGLLDEAVEELVILLNQNRYINELNLYRNNFSNKGAKQLAQYLPNSITCLNLGANNINDDDIEYLMKRESITALNLSSNNLTNDSVELLLSAAGQKNIKVYHAKIDDNIGYFHSDTAEDKQDALNLADLLVKMQKRPF